MLQHRPWPSTQHSGWMAGCPDLSTKLSSVWFSAHLTTKPQKTTNNHREQVKTKYCWWHHTSAGTLSVCCSSFLVIISYFSPTLHFVNCWKPNKPVFLFSWLFEALLCSTMTWFADYMEILFDCASLCCSVMSYQSMAVALLELINKSKWLFLH